MPTLFNNEMKVKVHDFQHYLQNFHHIYQEMQSLYCMSVCDM